MAEKSRLEALSGGIFSLIREFLAVKDDFSRCEDKNSNSEAEKEDSDKIYPEDDFGSIYVSDEMFLKLINRRIKKEMNIKHDF